IVVITDRGWRAAAHGRPAQYRLTFLPTKGAPATDDWKHFKPQSDLKFRYENVSTRDPQTRIRKRINIIDSIHRAPAVGSNGGAVTEPPAVDDEVIDLPDFL